MTLLLLPAELLTGIVFLITDIHALIAFFATHPQLQMITQSPQLSLHHAELERRLEIAMRLIIIVKGLQSATVPSSPMKSAS